VFCPKCEGEFRAGFTRCERCNVDLVDELKPKTDETLPPRAPTSVAEYCGFFALDDAREARNRLRENEIVSDIVIRDAPDSPSREEFWLRVDRNRYREAHAIIGDLGEHQPVEQDDDFDCGDCGKRVAAEESSCPGCGARFDDP
jgi:hypothetical protein